VDGGDFPGGAVRPREAVRHETDETVAVLDLVVDGDRVRRELLAQAVEELAHRLPAA